MRAAVILAVALALGSCDRKPSDPSLVQAEADDPRLAQAAKEAQRRWPDFVKAFKENKPGRSCAVKVPMPVRGGGAEHLWLLVTAINGDSVEGNINNEPVEDIGHKLGDRVTVKTADVEDWLYNDGSRGMIGGFSIKVLEQIQKEGGG